MLSSLLINRINAQFENEYPITPVANCHGVFQCCSLVCYYERNMWVIVVENTEQILASSLYKPYAFALMRIAQIFTRFSEQEQRVLRENLAPDLLQYIDLQQQAKPKHPGGRPRTGRRYKQYWINEEEDAAIKELLAEMRGKHKKSSD